MNALVAGPDHGGAAWSAPFYGLQHFPAGSLPASRKWATVEDLGTRATCTIYSPGCGFNPPQTTHADVVAARSYAEKVLEPTP